jgi:hypothetical protein
MSRVLQICNVRNVLLDTGQASMGHVAGKHEKRCLSHKYTALLSAGDELRAFAFYRFGCFLTSDCRPYKMHMTYLSMDIALARLSDPVQGVMRPVLARWEGGRWPTRTTQRRRGDQIWPRCVAWRGMLKPAFSFRVREK